jgi:hypothetical protein
VVVLVVWAGPQALGPAVVVVLVVPFTNQAFYLMAHPTQLLLVAVVLGRQFPLAMETKALIQQ